MMLASIQVPSWLPIRPMDWWWLEPVPLHSPLWVRRFKCLETLQIGGWWIAVDKCWSSWQLSKLRNCTIVKPISDSMHQFFCEPATDTHQYCLSETVYCILSRPNVPKYNQIVSPLLSALLTSVCIICANSQSNAHEIVFKWSWGNRNFEKEKKKRT